MERSRLTADLEAQQSRSAHLEQRANDVAAKLDKIKATHTRELDDAKESHQKMLRQRLEQEAESWEQKLKDALDKAKSERPKLRVDTSSPQLPKDSPVLNGVNRQTSFASAPVSASQAVVVDRLQTVVKQLEGQVSSLQQQLISTSKARDELAEELIKLNAKSDGLTKQVSRISELETELVNLNQRYVLAFCANSVRYAASLEMLGEKTELVEELRNDILDSKAAYKDQLEALVLQLQSARK